MSATIRAPCFSPSRAVDTEQLMASVAGESYRRAKPKPAMVAFPAVSPGIYGRPMDDGARIAVRTVPEQAAPPVEEVRFAWFASHAHAEHLKRSWRRRADGHAASAEPCGSQTAWTGPANARNFRCCLRCYLCA
ncbi:hypothetical protein [Streptomyces sp. NBC_01240]|uniref:hypothetical protein n=1 Tax=Streptomyces sp. NBC_01240 TaxID=2903793 RepID=UPI003FA3A36D